MLFSLWNIYLFGPNHAIDTNDDKRYRENLSHIEWERGLEGFLNLLGVLNEEAEGKDIGQAETKYQPVPIFSGIFLCSAHMIKKSRA